MTLAPIIRDASRSNLEDGSLPAEMGCSLGTSPRRTPAPEAASGAAASESQRPFNSQRPASTYDALIEQGRAIVVKLAAQIGRELPVRVDFDDLIAYGNLGLLEAAGDFDPGNGCQFTTYAYYRVRGAIYDGVAKMSWSRRAHWRKLRYARLSAAVLAEDAGGESASVEVNARRFGELVGRLAVVYLASQAIEGEADSPEFIDDSAPPDSGLELREVSEKLRCLIDALPRIEGSLIRLVYFDGMSLQEAGQRLGISKGWASKLHARTLESLGKQMRRAGVGPD